MIIGVVTMDVTKNIKTIREAKGITQSRLADLLEMERANYHRLENRGNKMSIEQLQSIANALEVSVVDILTGIEEKKEDTGLTSKIEELKGEIKVLYDRLKDKEYKVKSFGKEAFILKFLIVETLNEAIQKEAKLPDYIKFIKNNRWLLPLLSGLSLNNIQINMDNWKNFWQRATVMSVNDIHSSEVFNEDEPIEDIFWGEYPFSLVAPTPKLDKSPESQIEFERWKQDPNNEVETITFCTYVKY